MDVLSLMAAQHGVIARRQALAAGMTRHEVQGRISSGEWVPARRGVYRHAAVAPSWEGDLLTACFASRGVASHRCAAALWGIEGFWTPRVEVLIPRSASYRNPSHRVHRTTQWDRIDRTERSAIPCTGIGRTILDLGAVISIRRLEQAAESALRMELLTWDDLRACLIRHSRRGRDGCGRLRALLEERYGDDPLPLSAWSRLVANILADAGLPTPTLEFPVLDSRGALITQFDLAWPRHKVALELDSVRWHLNRKAFEHDKRKRNTARLLGWEIHEVTWSMSMQDHDGLIQLVTQALLNAAPPRNFAV